jgi:hypothetical protein
MDGSNMFHGIQAKECAPAASMTTVHERKITLHSNTCAIVRKYSVAAARS